MNVLHVCASPTPISNSASKQLAAAFFTKLAELNPDINVTNVDLYHNPPPYLSYDAYRAIWQGVYQEGYTPTDNERKAATYSRNQLQNVKEADVIVLTMPMWNYGMPAIMKAWLDQIIVPNELFTYEQDGPKRSHGIRKVILLISSGEVFKEGDPSDALTSQIDAIMNHIGISDVAVAWADGQDPIRHMDSEVRKSMAMEAAQELAEDVAELAGETQQ